MVVKTYLTIQMKKIILVILFAIAALNVFPQAPESFNYQAVIRDASGQEIVDQNVGIQISILQNSTPIYVEQFTPMTNGYGLITISIGTGAVQSGVFADIDWSAGPYFIKLEVDEAGGTTYVEMGTSQLLSVPYALHSATTDKLSIGDTWLKNSSELYYNDGFVGIGTNDPEKDLHINGSGLYGGPSITEDSNDRVSLLLTGGFPNIIMGSNGNDNHGATLGFWNFDNDETTYQWNLGGGQGGNFSIGFAKNSNNPHCGINGYTSGCTDVLTPILINPSGHVGINQLNPQYPLDVAGDAHVSGDLTVDGNIDIDVSSIINDILPAGMIVPFAGDAASIPDGWLLCDGSEVTRITYDRLFAAIGTNYGYGDNATTFNLPDFRGRFLRGTDNGAGNDPDAGSRTESATGGNTGDAVGSWQSYATAMAMTPFSIANAGYHSHSGSSSFSGNHSHSGTTSSAGSHSHSIIGDGKQLYFGHTVVDNPGKFYGLDTEGGASLSTSTAANHTHSLSITMAGSHNHLLSIDASGLHNHSISGGDTETRPENVSVNYIIKY